MEIEHFDEIIVSVSGGKDSQTALGLVCALAAGKGILNRVVAVHADTGAEWPQTEPHCRLLAGHYGIPLFVVRPARPLPESIRRRGRWPSAARRYCTSDHKRDPIARFVRMRRPAGEPARILIVVGHRAEESPFRARLPEAEPDRRLTAGCREVWIWRPILKWSAEDVWRELHRQKLPRHIAYDLGVSRLSCSICVLASERDIRIGAAGNPDLAGKYLELERQMGHLFRPGRSLEEILQGGGV